jgi:hypothetical protein
LFPSPFLVGGAYESKAVNLRLPINRKPQPRATVILFSTTGEKTMIDGRIPRQITVDATQSVKVQMNRRDVAAALFAIIHQEIGDIDDAGCDWLTDDWGNTYIGGGDWHVSGRFDIAHLVDAANVLINGEALKLEKATQ